jgi:hypothetical protein
MMGRVVLLTCPMCGVTFEQPIPDDPALRAFGVPRVAVCFGEGRSMILDRTVNRHRCVLVPPGWKVRARKARPGERWGDPYDVDTLAASLEWERVPDAPSGSPKWGRTTS